MMNLTVGPKLDEYLMKMNDIERWSEIVVERVTTST